MPSDTPDAKSDGPHAAESKGADAKAVVSVVNRRRRDEPQDELRRLARWLHFSQEKLCFGFEHLPSIALPLMSEERTGFALRFDKVTGFSVPAGIIRAAAVVSDDPNRYEYQLQLSLSMYHLASSSFFGSTWMGLPVRLSPSIFTITETTTRVPVTDSDENNNNTGNNDGNINPRASVESANNSNTNPRDSLRQSRTSLAEDKRTKTVVTKKVVSKVIDFDYQDIVYLISRIIDPSCVAVVEIVLTKTRRGSNVVVGQYGCGWTMLNLFQRPLPVDVADDRENMKLLSVSIFGGSPRDLSMFTDMKQLTEHLKPIPDCQLFLKSYTHRRLLRAQKYISDNVPIGRFDPIAGLVCREIVLPSATRPVWLSCLGDEERVDGGQGVHIYPAKPRLALPLVFKIANCQLFVPKRDALELRLIESIHHMFPSETKKTSIRILSRTLKFALHNGFTVVGNRWIPQVLKEDKDDRDILLISDAVVSLPGFIPDAHMAIVFIVEYQIGVLEETNSIVDPKALLSSVTELPKKDEQNTPSSITTGLLGAGAYIPFDGVHVHLSNTGRAPESDEGVDVEVHLFRDDTCSVLSPLPVLNERALRSAANDSNTNNNAAPAVGDAVAEEKNPAMRVSYMYDSKSGALLALNNKHDENKRVRISTNGGPLAGEKEIANPQDDEEAPMLGFDLRLFHPKRGEMKNLDSAEDLNRLEEKEGAAAAITAGGEEEDATAAERERDAKAAEEKRLKEADAALSESTSRFRRSTTGGVVAERERVRERERRYDDDDDDGGSVVESIVGGDEDRSHLRLDRFFYTSFMKKEEEKDKKRTVDTHIAAEETEKEINEVVPVDIKPSGAKNDSFLYLHSMNAKLHTNKPEELPQRTQPHSRASETAVDVQVAPKTVISAFGNAHYVREVSRGAKSRLNRYGFQDAIADSAVYAAHSSVSERILRGEMPPPSSSLAAATKRPVDLDLEIYDELNVHEINIQFAGFRAKTLSGSGGEQESAVTLLPTPKSLYFSFQFFTCAPTRSETLRVESTHTVSAGEMHVLSRDDPQARNEPPLVLRYIIDCSRATPLEALEFAEYLAHKSLYVDVWDAEGLLLMGTFAVPLRMLMRQGETMTKRVIECDVINAEIAAPSEGGVTSLTVIDNGPVAGEVVGSVSVMLSNYGYKGEGPYRLSRKTGVYGSAPVIPIEGLNWRAHGVPSSSHSNAHTHNAAGASNRVRARPKNKVRAKPLAETAPELDRALQDIRQLASSNSASFRSLASQRGAGGQSTLNYDEVVILFKRFPGTTKGTVQYAGSLMALLDLPSLPIVLKKLTKAFRQYSDQLVFKMEVLRFANSAEDLKAGEVEEFLRALFEKTGIKSREEERTLLARKILSDCGRDQDRERDRERDREKERGGVVSASRLVAFASEESDRTDWAAVRRRLSLCARKAELEGADVEQMLSDFDTADNHYISTRKFRDFLTKLSAFGKLFPADVTLCCRYFARHTNTRSELSLGEADRDAVSLAEVMAALGREYVGNLQARVQRVVRAMRESGESAIDAKFVLRLLNGGDSGNNNDQASGNNSRGYSYEQAEKALRALGLTQELSSQQMRDVLRRADTNALGRVSAAQMLTLLGVPFTAADLQTPRPSLSDTRTDTQPAGGPVTAEFLLRLLLEKAQKNGVAVDQAFRHFDSNGDGFISREELEQGLRSLAIFDSIPQWTAQLPAIVEKFERSYTQTQAENESEKERDGLVSLKEFFSFLGISDNYAPNILQRLTKIFAIATQKGVSFEDIFLSLDSDKDGSLDAEEILKGLKELGTFGEVTAQDAQAVVAQFTQNNNNSTESSGRVSVREFVSFFSSRVQQVVVQRRRARTERVSRRLREVLSAAQSKGASLRQIFSHWDKDGGGSVSHAELAGGLLAMQSFQSFATKEDVDELVKAMDTDRRGDISFAEFERFINNSSDNNDNNTSSSSSAKATGRKTLIVALREMLSEAESQGRRVEDVLRLLQSREYTQSDLERALQALPALQSLTTREEVQRMFAEIDSDRSGLVSLTELRDYVLYGQVHYDRDRRRRESESKRDRDREGESKRGESKRSSRSPSPAHARSASPLPAWAKTQSSRTQTDTLSEKRELLLRHVRRIAEVDGSVRGLLAYLDEDEDGLILRSRWFNLLRREDVFVSPALTERDVDTLIEHCYTGDREKIQLAPLLFFLEHRGQQQRGRGGDTSVLRDLYAEEDEGEGKDGERTSANAAETPYEFSRDLEVRAVEKKMRAFGRTLARNGVDVERHFVEYDARRTGCVLRTDFIKVLSSLGMYLLEEGKVLRDGVSTAGGALERDVQELQRAQIQRVMGSRGTFLYNAPRLARKIFDHPINGNIGEFKGHLESMTVIDWYRQSQKQMLLQQVLSHSLAHHINLFPRFGKTLFFEYPIFNPFSHEERFVIEVSDPELRVVTAYDEWTHLRRALRPCAGELGPDPVETEMFDTSIDPQRGPQSPSLQVALLPHETIYIPFAFLTLSPHLPPAASRPDKSNKRNNNNATDEQEDAAQRHIEVTIVSGSHGNIVAVLKLHLFPRPFVVDRVLRFHEFENTISRRRIRLTGIDASVAAAAAAPRYAAGEFALAMKYIHCVETTGIDGYSSGNNNYGEESSRVVVEWGSALQAGEYLPAGRVPALHTRRGLLLDGDGDANSIDMLIRYRCRESPDAGVFYLLIYDDPFQHVLHEVWQVVVQSRLRLDMHGTVGALSTADLVLRGDRHTRRAKAFASSSQLQSLRFHPDSVFQLVGGAYNRVVTTLQPKYVGQRRALVNVVDVDSRELLSAWLVSVQATAPAVMRSYDVEVEVGKPVFKKILFQNPWDVRRKFVVSSSDEQLMRPRTSVVEVAPLGAAYLRLWINGWQQGASGMREVHLFMNDAEEGQNEECHLFRIREANSMFA